jgi:hypothetical protein
VRERERDITTVHSLHIYMFINDRKKDDVDPIGFVMLQDLSATVEGDRSANPPTSRSASYTGLPSPPGFRSSESDSRSSWASSFSVTGNIPHTSTHSISGCAVIQLNLIQNSALAFCVSTPPPRLSLYESEFDSKSRWALHD